ncbi:MAG TPA: biosynthetic-type acetolactate synthase large subunit [Cyclobacteriaceae bacterium]|nr:biosynthetic-type acetolactate synthase large subunit [Cyclobacteriaceae bacterium]HMV07270.1 biosynthetic-type acetolactate synthase large subunit [Cyclobacteriaceae bacterium]HMV88585.1 biosynthetic-type acetolactate synthase large subunit [Cyclobacteriaceae bacterium]HMW99375.1 biosynthetic-type acetolactate synthase large subunit [Cyclobacteriaceae bacterium]HMX48836.1 biosynthetic-type acetolactate synthase large subunit [Cyclobacteriaceae bacterium]
MDALLTKIKPDTKEVTKQRISGSEALLRCLVAEGVDILFGYPGGAIMPVYDALYGFKDRLNHILVRHEQGAIHAAQGYARATGKTGVAMVTSGPGASNLITGLADASIDSTPVVCITGQVAEHLLGTDAFQEMDVINTTLPVTKWNVQITEASHIASQVAKAFYIARSGRPGPVLIDITKNAQFEMIDEFDYEKCESVRTYAPKPKLDHASVEAAAALINSAKKPYILAGQGVQLSAAEKELLALVEKSGIPVASTLLGLSSIPTNHPLYVGYLGMHGNYGPNVLTNSCDVLIAIGMRFDDRVTGNVAKYAKQAKVVHIELDKAEINKIVKANVAVHADAKEALKALLPLIKENKHPEWHRRFTEAARVEHEKVIQFDYYPLEKSLRMGEVIRELGEQTKGEAVIVTDVGQHQMVTSRYYPFRKTRSNITSGGAGTMGFALPAAMGAALAVPQKQVVAVIGDGGFQMTIQELGTIMQYQIPVKIIVLNNNFLGMVRQWQQLFFEKRYSFTEMTNPNFVALAGAYSIPAKKISERHELKDGLAEMLASKGPYFLEVVVEKEENVFPMVPTGAGVAEILLEPETKR